MLAFLELRPVELIVILLIALLLFGHKLPGLARSLGLSISEFKKGVRDGEKDLEAKPPAPAAPAEQPKPPVTPTPK